MKKMLALIALLTTIGAAHAPIASLAGITERPVVVAINRIQSLTGMNPESTWLNQEERWVRLGFGAYLWQTLCGSASSCSGNFSNLSIVPNGGTNVIVEPTVSSTIGMLYQFLPEETSAFGGYPSGVGIYLPTDSTKVMLQGTMSTASSSIGPLTPPLTSGQSINYLIECQVLTVDTTSVPINIVSPGGSVTPTTANRDREDTISCIDKAGVAATTGTQTTPSADSGYLGIGHVAVAYATVTITTGMITGNQPLAGFAQLTPASAQSGTLSVTGSITSATSINAPAILSGAGYVPPTVTAAGAATASTEHGLHGQVTSSVTSGQPCSTEQYVTLTNTGVFTSAATYSVVAAVDYTASTIPTGWTYAIAPIVQRVSGTSFGIQACGVVNAGSTGSLVIDYITSGY